MEGAVYICPILLVRTDFPTKAAPTLPPVDRGPRGARVAEVKVETEAARGIRAAHARTRRNAVNAVTVLGVWFLEPYKMKSAVGLEPRMVEIYLNN